MKSKLKTLVFLLAAILTTSILILPLGRATGDGLFARQTTESLARPSSLHRRLSSGETASQSADIDPLFSPARNSEQNLSVEPMLRAAAQDSLNGEGHTFGIEPVAPAEFNGDVRNLRPVPSVKKVELDLREPRSSKSPLANDLEESSVPNNNAPLAPMPAASQNFAGLSRTDAVTGGTAGAGTPPDINGDVGSNHYIEAVNDAYAIYSKTGTLQASFTENSLFSSGTRPGGLTGTGTLCDTNSFGDPVVLYDQFADRWILTNFAFVLVGNNQVPPTFQCFAVSKTSNPVAGGWWLYAVQIDTNAVGQPPTGTLGDYPKFGNWNDGCLYMGANGFSSAGSFAGVIFGSFSKSAMESGTALSGSNSSLGFLAFPANNIFTLVPSNISGSKSPHPLPPAGTPNYFLSESQTLFRFEVRKFTPGAGCGTGGTMGAVTNVTQTSYTVPTGDEVAQPNVANVLDDIDDRMMQKVQYRKVGSTESLWVTHNVKSGSTTRPQWAQINVTGGTVVTTPVQQQIYGPDATLNRWMGGLAVDHVGNMALGYSTSNGTVPNFPSIAYSGRLVTDALNTLPQTEVQLIAGSGSQNHTCGGAPCTRWGDYTSMSVDPVDDCTFWYTNEYYDTQANGTSGNWHTRIGAFTFPSCVPTAAPATISGRVTTAAGVPLPGVTMNLGGARTTRAITDSAGNYQFANLDTGNFYTVTPELVNHRFSPETQSFSLLGNKTDAAFTASLDAVGSANAIDTAEYFVRQHYLDFLNREPDESGFNFWSDQMLECGADATCRELRRINVSAAYFLSIEFQETGGLVDGLYRASYGRRPTYAEFTPDTGVVARDVVVGRGDWAQQLAANKQTFVDAWVVRPAFRAAYDGLSNGDYVETLLVHSSGFNGDRAELVNGLDSGALTRATVLRQIAENEGFTSAKRNEAFVMMEYFGYLRRDPDESGYQFWLNKLNQFGGNFVQAEMVKAFINSGEYRQRFGQ